MVLDVDDPVDPVVPVAPLEVEVVPEQLLRPTAALSAISAPTYLILRFIRIQFFRAGIGRGRLRSSSNATAV
jgi:hypothetical protein